METVVPLSRHTRNTPSSSLSSYPAAHALTNHPREHRSEFCCGFPDMPHPKTSSTIDEDLVNSILSPYEGLFDS